MKGCVVKIAGVLPGGAVMVALALSASAEAVDVSEMCDREAEAMAVIGKSPTNADRATCTCAMDAVKADVSEADFRIYAEVGAHYFEKLADGQSRADAWTDASKSVARARDMTLTGVLEITNPLGRRHQVALKSCKGG